MTLLLFPIEFLFFRCIFKIIQFLLRRVLKAIVYAPQLITGYMICSVFFSEKDSAALVAALVLLIAFAIYLFIQVLKSIMLTMKRNGNGLWLLLFIFIFSYTCIVPLWICFDTIEHTMMWIDKDHASLLTWVACLAFVLYIYTQYNFFNSR